MRFKNFLILILLSFGMSCQSERPILTLAAWPGYIRSDMIQAFEEYAGVKVESFTYSSNEELIAKLQAGAEFDVVYPSDYAVSILSKERLLQPLTLGDVNRADFDERFLYQPYDLENRYSLPYIWGTTGIAYRHDKISPSDAPKSWRDFWNFAKKNPGRASLLYDEREAIGAALKMVGKSMNATSPSDIESALKEIRSIWDKLRLVRNNPVEYLQEGTLWMAQVFSSEALSVADSKDQSITYIIPREGSSFWIDNLAIPARSAQPDLARRWIRFVSHDPRALRSLIDARMGIVMKENVLQSAQINADLYAKLTLRPQTLQKLEVLRDLGDDLQVWKKAWRRMELFGPAAL